MIEFKKANHSSTGLNSIRIPQIKQVGVVMYYVSAGLSAEGITALKRPLTSISTSNSAIFLLENSNVYSGAALIFLILFIFYFHRRCL